MDQFNNTVGEVTVFQVKITFGDTELFENDLQSGVPEQILISKGAAGEINITVALNGNHIKGSPHYIEAFIPKSDGNISPDAIGGIVGGFFFVLILAAIKFWQHKKKSSAKIAEANRRLHEEAERANLLLERNAQLNESLRKKKHSEEELRVMKKAMEQLTEEKCNELRGVIIPSSEVKIKGLLGKGGFCEVHLATYQGSEVALKTLLDMNEENVFRFRQECFLMKNLNHPHVVRLIGVCWDNILLGCVLEYMPMGTLEDWLKKTQ